MDNQEAAVEEIQEEMEPREERVFRLLRKQKCVVEEAAEAAEAMVAAEAAEAMVAAEMEAQTIIMESQVKNPVPEEVVAEHLMIQLTGKLMVERDTMDV